MTRPKRVHVDPKLCEGHALCIDIAPRVFNLSDDDVASSTRSVSTETWDQVRAAIDACPRGAISMVED